MNRVAIRAVAGSGLAFTLVELLVVISIVAVLIALLLPSLADSRAMARQVACASNLRGHGIAIMAYCVDQRDTAFPATPRFSSMWKIRMSKYMGYDGDTSTVGSGTSTWRGGLLNDRFGFANSPEQAVKGFKCPEARNGSSGLYYLSDYAINFELTSSRDWNDPDPATNPYWVDRRTLSQIKTNPSRIPLTYDHGISTPIDNWAAFNSTLSYAGRIVGHADRTVVNTSFIDGRVEGLKKNWRRDMWYFDGKTPGWY